MIKRYSKHFQFSQKILTTFAFSFIPCCRRKKDVSTFLVPDSMNPKVYLKNIWQELAESGTTINLLPAIESKSSIQIRYSPRTVSLFGGNI